MKDNPETQKVRNFANHPWRILEDRRPLPVANRPEGWRAAKTEAEARAMITDAGLPAGEIVARSMRRAATGSEEIQHPELDRMRAETIRRYSEADRAHAASRDGFVYVMSHSLYSPGVVKIGHSRDPYKRASQANTNSAEGRHTIRYMRYFKDRALVESLVHSALWDHRVQGEHFRVSVGEAIRVVAQVEE